MDSKGAKWDFPGSDIWEAKVFIGGVSFFSSKERGTDSLDKIGRFAGKFGQSGFGIQFETYLSPALSPSLK